MILILGLIIGLVHEHIGEFGEGVNSWNTIHPVSLRHLENIPLYLHASSYF